MDSNSFLIWCHTENHLIRKALLFEHTKNKTFSHKQSGNQKNPNCTTKVGKDFQNFHITRAEFDNGKWFKPEDGGKS